MISVIIPIYNGRELLQTFLPGLQKALAGMDIVVVDDGSTDGTADILPRLAQANRIIVRDKNGGFSAAVNDGIRATNSDFIVLLNNDVEVSEGFLDSILPLFDDETVFSVSPKILLPKYDNLDEGCKTGAWHHGIFYTDQRQGVSQPTPILYTTGCAAVYRRSMLEKLGGFDEAYSPFYWEDTDLGYRAWKRGWKSLYQPASVVHHQHSASISLMNRDYTASIKARNSLFFIWRNIDDPDLISRHRMWLPLTLLRRSVCDRPFIKGWCEAYLRKDEASAARKIDSGFRTLSDREIFSICGVK